MASHGHRGLVGNGHITTGGSPLPTVSTVTLDVTTLARVSVVRQIGAVTRSGTVPIWRRGSDRQRPAASPSTPSSSHTSSHKRTLRPSSGTVLDRLTPSGTHLTLRVTQ